MNSASAWTARIALAIGFVCTALISAHAQDNSSAQIERGRYLTQASNCQGCHTNERDKPFAGARGLGTPFGTIFTPNITFDPDTGLGRWTRDDFRRAMSEGRSRDGSRLYPAFPYVHFTKMPREDVDAVYDYLSTLPRIRNVKPENDLPFPLKWRSLMAVWNWMFFEKGTFQTDPARSAAWNRGAYLVVGPGHCGGCHTGKNLLGADKDAEHLKGGLLDNWYAPNIRAGRNGGLARWTEGDIVEFLRTGRNVHTGAFSIMSEVIEYSMQFMTEDDLSAIATYLKSLDNDPPEAPVQASREVMQAGRAIYFDNCSACHKSDGTGVPRFFASLKGSGKANAPDPTTVVRAVLEGARAVPTKSRPTPLSMPAFDWKLTDAQIAAVATYVRQSWGNSGSPVTPQEVETLRKTLREEPHF
jgi:mono/diheme cytochrome c family protein